MEHRQSRQITITVPQIRRRRKGEHGPQGGVVRMNHAFWQPRRTGRVHNEQRIIVICLYRRLVSPRTVPKTRIVACKVRLAVTGRQLNPAFDVGVSAARMQVG